MAYPLLMTGVTPAGMGRVPLHPDDASRFADQHLQAMQRQRNAFDQKMARLGAVAAAKRGFDFGFRSEPERVEFPLVSGDDNTWVQDTLPGRMHGPGPVDQEQSLRQANELADSFGVPDPSLLSADLGAYVTSQPGTRNALFHMALIPENAIFQAGEALSGQKPAGEIASRLARSVPGAFYPPAGYAVEPARDRMYEKLGPAAGFAVDYLMPGPAEAIGGLSSVVRAADKGLRSIPMRADLVDDAGDVIRRLRAEAQ